MTMKAAPRYRLKLKSLDLISAVRHPAQTLATAAIIKAASPGAADTSDDFKATCVVAKVSDELGIVFGFAITSTVDGAAYFDLQGDAVDEAELIKAAAEYVDAGGGSDQEHDGASSGRAIFVFPLTSEIATALQMGDVTKTGLLVGIKVAPDVLAGFKDGTYSGFSIAGEGERTPLAKATEVPDNFELVARIEAETTRIETAMKTAGAKAYAATNAAKLAPIAKATTSIDTQIQSTTDEMAKIVEAFAVQHNLDLDRARMRLMQISPPFAKMYAALNDLYMLRSVAAFEAEAAIGPQWQDRQPEDAVIARTLDESDPRVRFGKALGAFAKSMGQSEVQATHAFMRTPTGAELYAQVEQQRWSSIRN